MKLVKKILIASLILSLSFTFVSLAYIRNEGMVAINQTDSEARYGYRYSDGTIAMNEWKQAWECWYYFDENGNTLQNTWAEIDEKWYYFDQWSIMSHDTITPDGYSVGADGTWVESGNANLTDEAEASGPAGAN